MWNKLFLVGVVMFGLLLAGGCAENKKQIDELTLNKQDLEGQLQQLKGELDEKQAELTKCQDQLASLRGERGQLQQQLESARRQPAQAQLPAGWEIHKGMVMTSLPEAVLFAPGKAQLLRSAPAKLNRVLQQIKTNFPGRDVYIIGHTDSNPIRRTKALWQDNLDLSLNRAAAVTRYMIDHGLNTKQVIAGGAGQYRPVSKSKTRNRRVEFWILKPM
ncbi:MAG: OmpA family protein [Phycisphaerae bacterium]